MSETQEHKDTTEEKGRFKGVMFQENYRKDRAAYREIVQAKFNDIITVQELLNQYGDKKLTLKHHNNTYIMDEAALLSPTKDG